MFFQVDVVLKLWKKGFSVDDGPLRDYHDPANKQFLDSIHNGCVILIPDKKLKNQYEATTYCKSAHIELILK